MMSDIFIPDHLHQMKPPLASASIWVVSSKGELECPDLWDVELWEEEAPVLCQKDPLYQTKRISVKIKKVNIL